MNLLEAKCLISKLKLLEGNCVMIAEKVIHNFYIVPSRKYLRKHKIEISLIDFHEVENYFSLKFDKCNDVEIVAVHFHTRYEILKSYDLNYFKELIKNI